MDLREELGDVLYQVVLQAGIAARARGFGLADVAETARDETPRRHPHVFGADRAEGVEDVVRLWRAAKADEKASRASAFDGVPRACRRSRGQEAAGTTGGTAGRRTGRPRRRRVGRRRRLSPCRRRSLSLSL